MKKKNREKRQEIPMSSDLRTWLYSAGEDFKNRREGFNDNKVNHKLRVGMGEGLYEREGWSH
jgi:hypothetical protein